MKILVAEDDVYTRKGLVEIFENEGHTVVSAASGDQAVSLFSDERPDFVCLDIMMPGINGYDVCREIRKTDADVPVLFLSAKAEEIDKVVGLELGADDYIVKPFGVRELLARVSAIHRRCRNEPENRSERLEIGDLEVAPSELRAYRGDEAFDLSLRDIKLLSHFAENRGKVVTRNELFDVGWGCDYMPNSRSLDQYISQLRKKIELDPKTPRIITTVHTAGYRYPL
jgi:two-component system, OmpR family, alkaline phosphatase synthesis response regulator PhoP